MTTDFSRSIQDLEQDDWGSPNPDDTEMVQRCHALRRKPLARLTPEEVGLAVRQQVGIPHILELAVRYVRDDPLFEGGNYPGDVLSALIRTPSENWASLPGLKKELDEIACQALEASKSAPDEWNAFRWSLDLPDAGSSAH
jgi:hypothetical protein